MQKTPLPIYPWMNPKYSTMNLILNSAAIISTPNMLKQDLHEVKGENYIDWGFNGEYYVGEDAQENESQA